VAKMLDNTQSIICAFGLAAAAPRSPYRHLELCGATFIIAGTAATFQTCFGKNKTTPQKRLLLRGCC
ncbi:MAG: hypothetical protein KH007_11635, partial [Subdoligranulum variabile]|nr:hypothetical protein [Subdoligranulum variabile]